MPVVWALYKKQSMHKINEAFVYLSCLRMLPSAICLYRIKADKQSVCEDFLFEKPIVRPLP